MKDEHAPISLRLLCMKPPSISKQESIIFGIQDRHQEVHVGQVQSDGSILYEIDVSVTRSKENDTIRFRENYVHGTPQAPFLYLSLQRLDGEQASWIRRLKIPLPQLSWGILDNNVGPISLIGRVEGTRNGTVPLLDGGWKMDRGKT